MSDELSNQKIISLIDLTSLNATDTPATIDRLCFEAKSKLGPVAAVCVYPQFVKQAKKHLLNTSIKIATVANFPDGDNNFENVKNAISQSIADGADEIDVVFPYKNYLTDQHDKNFDFIRQCKLLCGNQTLLKVILETGALSDNQVIATVSEKLCYAGADFLKTSTGKISIGATPPAVEIMLKIIKNISKQLNREIGLKVAGGVRTVAQARQYIDLADAIFSPEWVIAKHFRIGASQLLHELVS